MARKKSIKKGAKGRAFAPIESFAKNAGQKIPSRRMRLWLAAYLHPEETLDSEKGNPSFSAIAMHLALAGLLAGAVMALALLVSSFFEPLAARALLSQAIFLLAGYPLLALVGGFAGSAAAFAAAKMVGGRGGYMEQTLGLALVYGGSILASAPFSVLAQVPAIGIIMFVAWMAIGVYTLYNYYRVIMHVQGISGAKAACAIIISAILLMAATVLLASWVAASMAATA